MLPPLSRIWGYEPPLNATAYQIFHEFILQQMKRSFSAHAAPVAVVPTGHDVTPVQVDVRV